MNEKTKQYVQFIKENHKSFGGSKSGSECAKELGITQGRVSQLIKEMKNSAMAQVGPVETAEA